MDNRRRRDSGMAYFADESVTAEMVTAKKAVRKYNECMPFDVEQGVKYLNEAGIRHKGSVYFEPPFHCEYGSHIEIGEGFYANTGCVMLDVGRITIGDNVLFGPNVSLYTAGHPIHPESRKSGYEYGIPIKIGDNVWIGGSCVILPGVTIGNNVVIGAGSVVTKDIPDNVCAAGNPCRVIREITEEDRLYYYKDRKFDDEVWEKINRL
ncbi:MAG TPA: sugar O-acetyltransferase [Candidatus Blautia faecipullorum]|nr:sugar O-acetyltransferase [Candidatus Blautia faecipullorum]